MDPENTTLMAMASPEWPQFNSEIYMHTVVPNLMRLGLITERTEADYRRIGIVYGDRFPSVGELPIAS